VRILVVRTDRLGDVLLSTPVARALKETDPRNHVTMMVSPYTKPVLDSNPHVDDVIVYEHEKKNRELLNSLSRGRFDAAVVLHPTFRLAWVLARAGIPARFGTASRLYSFLFNKRISLRRSVAGLHESECNLAMVEPLCGKTVDLLPEIFITQDERVEAARLLRSLALNSGDFVVIHPGSGGSARDWPLSSFASLADGIMTSLGRRVLVTGGPEEVELVGRMIAVMRERPASLVGSLDVRQLASVLREAEVLVTNSTGPMHLATAVSTPVVAVFCPIEGCDPRRWGPLGDGNVVLRPEVPNCKKCVGERCVYYDCMERVSVEAALAAVERLLLR
jgi:heptosyltransferase-3